MEKLNHGCIKDNLMLCYLRRNSRASLTYLSKKTKLPISTLHEKLKKFTKFLITKFTVNIDFSKLGYTIRVFLLIRSRPDQKNDLINFLISSFNTNDVLSVHNDFDIIAQLYFKSLKEFEEFRTQLRQRFELVKEEIAYVLEQPLQENFFSNPDIIGYFN